MTRFLLMGGLGNQLFQLAGALNYTEVNSKIELVDKIGNPRTNKSGRAEISSFKLPEDVHLKEMKLKSVILQMAINFGIRLSAKRQKMKLLKLIYRLASKLLAILLREKNSFACLSNGVGYDSGFKASRTGINVGYFQSYMYLLDLRTLSFMRELRINEPSDDFKVLEARAIVETPLIVHVRLGDYKNEKAFGIPSSQYYLDSLEYFEKIDPNRSIWLFSNEPKDAFIMIPEKYHHRIYLVPIDSLSSAETLELMRNGTSYIIGNSSFSWWGAALSLNEDAKVISPRPWFRGSDTPNQLIPDKWLEFDAHYDIHGSEKWT